LSAARSTAARGSRKRLSEEAVGAEEEAQRVVFEQLDHAAGRREKVEAARGRRRVEDDEVHVRVDRVLVQRLDAHVLEDAGQRVDEAGIETVLVDAPERVGARHAREEALERRLRVDLEGEELPLARQARHAHGDGLSAPAACRVEVEGLREAPRRVDGEDERAPPAPRGGEADGGGKRRLPDAAGAGQHDELLPVEPGGEVEMRRTGNEEGRRRGFA
jgi:hypothetical protein